MRKNKKNLSALLISIIGLLSSCNNVPEDIAKALGSMSFMTAYQKIGEISYRSEMKSYTNQEFTGETNGLKTTSFVYKYLGKTDSQITLLSATYIQHFEGTFVNDGITDSVETIGFDSDKDTYIIDVTETKDGVENKKDTQDKGSSYYSTLEDVVFGDDDTHQNGLYYGQFLQTLSGNFSSMMSYDEESGILTYDPPVTGKYIEHPENFADMIYKVDKLGMLVYSQGKYYDTEANNYFIEEINVSYKER